MPDILHDFPIRASTGEIFAAVSTPRGLDRWWTLRSAGRPALGERYELFFGPEYDWRATVSACNPDRIFELELTDAMPDWIGSRVRFELVPDGEMTTVRFSHRGWPAESEHYRISSFCWAMYLRLMKRSIETGEVVEYAIRLDV